MPPCPRVAVTRRTHVARIQIPAVAHQLAAVRTTACREQGSQDHREENPGGDRHVAMPRFVAAWSLSNATTSFKPVASAQC